MCNGCGVSVMLKRFVMVIMLGMVMLTSGAVSAQNTVQNRLTEALADVPGIELVSVVLSDSRAVGGERIALIKYVTVEMDEFAYRAEVLDVFRAAGEAIHADGVDVDRMVLYVGVTTTDLIERIEAAAQDIRDLAAGELTRTQFLSLLIVTELGHSLPGHGPGDPV